MKRALLLTLCLLSSSGCYRFHYRNGAATPGPTPVDGQWHHDFLYFIESDHVSLGRQCPQGWAQVDHQIGVFQALAVLGGSVILGALTGVGGLMGVIWQPSEVKVTCAAAPALPAPAAPPGPPVYPGSPPPPPPAAPQS